MSLEASFLHFLAISPLTDFEEGFETQEVLDSAIAIFAMVLLALTLSAYRKTKLRRLILVSAAFGLFAVEVAIRQVDDFVLGLSDQTTMILVAGMEFVVLLLFFLAVVVRD